MCRSTYLLTILLFSMGSIHTSAQYSTLLFANDQVMTESKEAIQSGDQNVLKAFMILKAEAEQALAAVPRSVMDKDFLPPSGDKHDYISQGPYWWPDPSKSDGLPYIRRDGEVNPERDKFTDHTYFSNLMDEVDVLAKAYYFSENEKYAEKAIDLLQVWFLDEATRMNPNLNFGQGIPGRTQGRGIGIIETSKLGKITDAIGLLKSSIHWTAEDEAGMHTWMQDYLEWLLTSEHGKKESIHPNNHGTWYDVQVCALAIYTGKENLAIEIIEKAKSARIDAHIRFTGEQPKETARTKGWSYSTMNLWGLFQLAMVGEYVDIDLWNYKNVNGVTLFDALDYLIPFALQEKTLPFEQISPIRPERLIPHLLVAQRLNSKKSYALVADQIKKMQDNSNNFWDLLH